MKPQILTDIENNKDEITNLQTDLATHLTDYATYVESELGNEHIIRELPNGVKDEFDVQANAKIQKVSHVYTLDQSWFKLEQTDRSTGLDLYLAGHLFTARGLPTGNIDTGVEQRSIICIDGEPLTRVRYWSQFTAAIQYNTETALGGLVRISVPTGQTLANALNGKKITFMYELVEPQLIPLPDPMTPNTREIARLSEQVDKLTNAVIALGGTMV